MTSNDLELSISQQALRFEKIRPRLIQLTARRQVYGRACDLPTIAIRRRFVMYRVVQKTLHKLLMRRHSAIVCSRITRFLPKFSEKSRSTSQCIITAGIGYMLWATSPCMWTLYTSDSWRSTANKDFGNWKKVGLLKLIVEFLARH